MEEMYEQEDVFLQSILLPAVSYLFLCIVRKSLFRQLMKTIKGNNYFFVRGMGMDRKNLAV